MANSTIPSIQDLNGNIGIGTLVPNAKLDVAGGVDIQGNIRLTGTATTTNQGRLIDFTGFDKETDTDFSDRAYIAHTQGVGGHEGSVLHFSSQNDSGDGIAFTTHASSQLKHNGNTIWTSGNLTDVSQLTNDAGYTGDQDLSSYYRFRGSVAINTDADNLPIGVWKHTAQAGITNFATTYGTTISFDTGTYYGWQLSTDSAGHLRNRANHATWTDWITMWDSVNLTNVSQLTNDAGYANTEFDSIADLSAPDATTGTWNTATTTDWGKPRIGESVARYIDGAGDLSFTVPTGMKTAYISQLTWSSGGYADIYGIQADGDAIFLRRINTKQTVENDNHQNPNMHDGSTIAFAGHIGDYPTIRISNKSGRLHLTGLGFSKSEAAASDGTGMVHPSQLSNSIPYSSVSGTPDLSPYYSSNGGTYTIGTGKHLELKHTTPAGYSEMNLSNDTDEKLVIGSIGSEYTSTAWAGSRYIYSTAGELRIKAATNLRLYSGGHAHTGNLAVTFDSNQDATFNGDISATNLSGTNTGDQDLSGYLLNTADTFTGDLKVDNGRVLITNSAATGGGDFNPALLAYTATEQAYGRAQVLLASGYSDITIGSSQANDNHGSTLTFATVNPAAGADYRKFVIGQGNWGARSGYLDFGYDGGSESQNPHGYINSSDVSFTVDGVNNRIGLNSMSPTHTLDVNGDAHISNTLEVDGNVTLAGKMFTDSSGDGAYGGAIEIRETAKGGALTGVWNESPGISFHWGARVAKRFGIRADGQFAVDDSPIALQSGTIANATNAVNATNATNAVNADTVDGQHINPSYGVGKQINFTINGASDTYYPVIISGASNPRMTRITVYRSYTETAPNDWNNSTHKGGLTLDYTFRFGGWGGYPNMFKVENYGEIYSRIFGGMDYTAHTIKHVIWLRGGGANYHIDTPLSSLTVTVCDSTSNDNYASSANGGTWYSYTNTPGQPTVHARTQAQADIGAQNAVKKMPMLANGSNNNAASIAITNQFTGNVTGDVTGNLTGNAGTVTNGVYTTGNQTIGGSKTLTGLLNSNSIIKTGLGTSPNQTLASLNPNGVITSMSSNFDLIEIDSSNNRIRAFTGSVGQGNLIFPTTGGTSYSWTLPLTTGTIALTSNLASYLPLTGGTIGGDLTVNGGNITINSNNGGIQYNDVSSYWIRTATNWGLYWNTSNNTLGFHGAGNERGSIDLDNGNLQMDGTGRFGSYVATNTSQGRSKIRLWDTDTNYAIGFKSGYDFGHLGNSAGTGGEYAISFMQNDNNARGFWWGKDTHSDVQGAMALTTDGRLNVAKSISIGEGESVINPSSSTLYVKGETAGDTVLDIQGTQGQLFAITDNLVGDIFSVSDISGVPILNVNSDGTSYFDGNVGIGLIDPDSRLDINAGVANIVAGPAVRISKGASPIGLIRYDTVVIEANDVATIRIGESDGTVSSIMSGDNNLRINSTDPIKFYTAGTTTGEAHAGQGGTLAMIIDNSQRVGIGTTSPSAHLQLKAGMSYGAFRISPSVANGESAMAFFTDVAGTSTASAWVVGHAGWGNTLDFVIGCQNAGGPVITAQPNGYVGIGTTSPSEKLQVNGRLYIEHQGSNWNETTPGLTKGAIHLDPVGNGADHTGNAITFGASDHSNGSVADAGIYTRSDGTYGTKMYFATTDSYSVGSKTRMMINSNGYIGINDISPSYNLDVNGAIRATGDIIAYSDIRVKENIKTIPSALDKVSKLRGVEFNKIGEEIKSIGVIAQEIEKIIPEVVRVDDKGMKSVAYGNITGVLIEAIKEQQTIVNQQQKEINTLKELVGKLINNS